MDKLGAHSRAQMIALAYQQGLVTATPEAPVNSARLATRSPVRAAREDPIAEWAPVGAALRASHRSQCATCAFRAGPGLSESGQDADDESQ
jgi:hypothetical protein